MVQVLVVLTVGGIVLACHANLVQLNPLGVCLVGTFHWG